MTDISLFEYNNEQYNFKDSAARLDIATINGMIPSGASSSNKLATQSDIDLGLSVVNGKLCVRYEK